LLFFMEQLAMWLPLLFSHQKIWAANMFVTSP
jgi:hypothetical protein